MPRSINISINDFHPTMRTEIEKEIARLLEETPPFGPGGVNVHIADHFTIGGKSRSMEKMGYAITNHDVKTGYNDITLSAELFGVNGNLKRLKELNDADSAAGFHGEMNSAGSTLAHEYGHAFKGMLHQCFIDEPADKDGKITAAYQALMKKGQEEAIANAEHVPSFVDMLFHHKSLPAGNLVSGYANNNGDEFFAETFSARHFSPAMKDNETVKLLNDLIKITYERIAEMGEAAVRILKPRGSASEEDMRDVFIQLAKKAGMPSRLAEKLVNALSDKDIDDIVRVNTG